MRLADSSWVKIGKLTIAIGNPFGSSGTMTTGVVSALGRLLPPERDGGAAPGFSIPNVIQTDAPINPGNSGGVLVDRQGQVIGVNTAIISLRGRKCGDRVCGAFQHAAQDTPVVDRDRPLRHPWLGVSGARWP